MPNSDTRFAKGSRSDGKARGAGGAMELAWVEMLSRATRAAGGVEIKCSPASCCHASSTAKWKEFRDGYRWFASLYRAAANRLKRGTSSAGV